MKECNAGVADWNRWMDGWVDGRTQKERGMEEVEEEEWKNDTRTHGGPLRLNVAASACDGNGRSNKCPCTNKSKQRETNKV